MDKRLRKDYYLLSDGLLETVKAPASVGAFFMRKSG